MKTRKRSAFTLIELLIVIGIVMLLMSWLLPSVQRVREAANRLLCQNNVKQLALALQSHEATHGCFPPGLITKPDDDDLQNGRATGFHFLLPYLDQDHVQRQWQRSLSWFDAPNFLSSEAPIRVLCCPSNRAHGNQDLQSLAKYFGEPLPNPAVTDYLLCKGANANLCPFSTMPRGERGPFDVNSATRIVDILDGTSNTFAIGEGTGGHPVFQVRLKYAATTAEVDSRGKLILPDQGWALGMVVNGETAAAGYPCVSVLGVTAQRGGFTPPMDEVMNNRLVMAAVDYNQSTDNSEQTIGVFDTLPGFRSLHGGGCNFAFCDGSVRFMSSFAGSEAYRALSTIAGRELQSGY